MTHLRVLACVGLVGLFSATAAAQPPPPVEKSAASVAAGMAWTRDLTVENKLIPGVSAGFDLPVGRGQWVVFEGSYHWHKYSPVVEDSLPRIPEIKRYGGSVAGRLGRASGSGPFIQVGAGFVAQSLSGISDSRNRVKYESDTTFWVGPGAGVDVRVSDRLAIRALVEVLMFPTTPGSRFAASRYRVGLVYRLPR
jgi:opacity protein-like surface antigen